MEKSPGLFVFSDQMSIIESGGRMKISTTTYVFNIPKTHYIAFQGINTNISISAESGVIHPDKNGGHNILRQVVIVQPSYRGNLKNLLVNVAK